jgi:hypothetical protein
MDMMANPRLSARRHSLKWGSLTPPAFGYRQTHIASHEHSREPKETLKQLLTAFPA